MLDTYTYPVYSYRKSADQEQDQPARHPLVVVGAGPVGMAAAIDAAQQGIPTLVLDDDNTVSVGSRAVCYSKRCLEVFDRLGCAAPMIDKGVTWHIGKIFFRDHLVRQFDLLPTPGHKIPAFINLQQYYLEEYLVARAGELDNLEIRWNNKVTGVTPSSTSTRIDIETPDGPYQLDADWLIVADGANSPIREQLGLKSDGQWFHDRFLIADIVMKAGFPPERWFSFDPSYHPGQSTLLHRQADDVWRLDFQLGWDADPEEEKKPENVIPRVKAMLGDDVEFELEWCSVYTFRCRRMDRFRHGRLLFVGDAAHQVSPFGARGANSGVQDTDNLVWKLKLVIQGKAPESLLDSYSDERVSAADENILNSTRSTDFITPKSEVSHLFRDSVLELAEHLPFAQALINSGRLSDTSFLTDSTLNTPDSEPFTGDMVPGAVIDDAPLQVDGQEGWLLEQTGNRFTLLLYLDSAAELSDEIRQQLDALKALDIPVQHLVIHATGNGPGAVDQQGMFRERFDALPGSCYLLRPDQHVAARWRSLDVEQVKQAVGRATGNTQGEQPCH